MATKDRRASSTPHQPTGIPVDGTGGPTVDPTKNVLDLVAAATLRVDDLANLRAQMAAADIKHQKEVSDLRAHHQDVVGRLREAHSEKMAAAEAGRLNSIRQVDRDEVAKTAMTTQTATTALANQTSILAETLRTQVGTVAAAAESRAAAVATAAEGRLNQFSADVIKRLSALELSYSEGRGKQAVVDPQIGELKALVEQLTRDRSVERGKDQGLSTSWALLLGVVSLLGGLILIGTFIFITMRTGTPSQPQVIYVPSPPGTMLPSTPPSAVPR